MFGGGRMAVFGVILTALCLLCLPVWPASETTSVELRPQEVRNTAALLGEGREAAGGRQAATRPSPAEPSAEPLAGSAQENMTLTVPKLGLGGVPVPTGSEQAELDREGVLRVKGSGLPWVEGSNTFIAGHALGYPYTKVPRAFHDLADLMPGDEVLLQGADGRRYTFEVYDRMTVEPDDTWVMEPVEDKTVLSLQTCVPIPTFENRLIVRAELAS